MEKINWKVEGMTCSNCALSVNKVLQKQGMKEISVNPITGEVFFETITANGNIEKAKQNIELLGYSVQSDSEKISPKKKMKSRNLI